MNRREVVKGMIALPALGLMGGCQWFSKHCDSRTPPGTKLCVILQGAFAVVLHKGKDYRVTAFVPKTDPADSLRHEFRFQNLDNPPCETGYGYELLRDGLEVSKQQPRIDRGFDNVLFSINKWVPDPENYFVMLDLPAPDAIGYLSPLLPALFDSGHDSGTRLGSVPRNLLLEYRVCGADGLKLQPKQAQMCGTERDLMPLRSDQLLEKYKTYYRREMPDQAEDPAYSQRPNIARLLKEYSYFYFFGAGPAPLRGTGKDGPTGKEYSDLMTGYIDHGISFFNERLLPSIYQRGQAIPPGSKLKKLGKAALQCDGLQNIASTENCTSPVAVALAGKP